MALFMDKTLARKHVEEKNRDGSAAEKRSRDNRQWPRIFIIGVCPKVRVALATNLLRSDIHDLCLRAHRQEN